MLCYATGTQAAPISSHKLNHNVGWVCGVASLSPTQIEGFKTVVMPLYKHCRKSVVHNDLNDYNLIAKPDASDVQAVLDFGDVVMTYSTSQVAPPHTSSCTPPTLCLPPSAVNELAICLAYFLMRKPDPVATACIIVKAYHSVMPLTSSELQGMCDCMHVCVDVQTYTPAVDVACLVQCCCHWSACGWQQASCARQKPCRRTLAMRST